MRLKTPCRLHSVLFFVSVALSASCFNLFDREWSFDEVSRVTNPSGKVDAVLVERNGGATTSFGYEVFVVPRGKSATKDSEIASLYGATRSNHAYGVNLKWEGGNNLVIEYLNHRGAELKKPISMIDGEEAGLTHYKVKRNQALTEFLILQAKMNVAMISSEA